MNVDRNYGTRLFGIRKGVRPLSYEAYEIKELERGILPWDFHCILQFTHYSGTYTNYLEMVIDPYFTWLKPRGFVFPSVIKGDVYNHTKYSYPGDHTFRIEFEYSDGNTLFKVAINNRDSSDDRDFIVSYFEERELILVCDTREDYETIIALRNTRWCDKDVIKEKLPPVKAILDRDNLHSELRKYLELLVKEKSANLETK